jgi:regulator of protease activity HflC (stomatin/prohibitin superfamily)
MDWLREIVDWVRGLLPQLRLVNPDERGVYVVFGRWTHTVGPGAYLCWPCLIPLHSVLVTPKVIDIPSQSVESQDGASLAVSGAISFGVRDPALALFAVQDYEEAIVVVALGEVAKYCAQHDAEECKRMGVAGGELEKRVQRAARGWGVVVKRVWITDLVHCRTYRLLGDRDRLLGLGGAE